jgi:hypothetical protein
MAYYRENKTDYDGLNVEILFYKNIVFRAPGYEKFHLYNYDCSHNVSVRPKLASLLSLRASVYARAKCDHISYSQPS